MKEILLNASWLLHEAPLDWEADRLSSVQAFERGWMPCSGVQGTVYSNNT